MIPIIKMILFCFIISCFIKHLLFCFIISLIKDLIISLFVCLNRVSSATVKSFAIGLVSKNVFTASVHRDRTSNATVISDGQASFKNKQTKNEIILILVFKVYDSYPHYFDGTDSLNNQNSIHRCNNVRGG